MDSGLLNVFHDDPFDGNYVKYDNNNADFWSSGSESMGLQLAETLHGILPIAPTEDASILYGNAILKDDYTLDCKDDAVTALQTKNALIFDDFTEHHVTSGGSIEIMTVNTNGVDSDDDDDTDIDASENDEAALDDDFDRLSQRSNTTFRSRTDSSSIGDYESHSSDYDDEEEDEVTDMHNGFIGDTNGHYMHVPELITNGISNFKLPLETSTVNSKNRTYSTNTIGSDVDALGLQIDANTFDLAEFITKDDFALSNSSTASIKAAPTITTTTTKIVNTPTVVTQIVAATAGLSVSAAPVQVISSKHDDSDSDSDVIVDVETVEFESSEEKQLWPAHSKLSPVETQQNNVEVIYEDNVRTDPSWSPLKTNLKKEIPIKEAKPTEAATPATSTSAAQQQTQQHNFTRSFSVIPSKRQCDFLKGKFGSGRGKNISMQRLPKVGAAKFSDIKLETIKTPKKEEEPTGNAKKQTVVVKPKIETLNIRKMGMGMGGKNLALIKHERCSISEPSSEENTTPIKKFPPKQPEEQSQLQHPIQTGTLAQIKSVKRKLNLEEYKIRRGAGEHPIANETAKHKIAKFENGTKPQNFLETSKQNGVNKHSAAVTSIVQSLKSQSIQPKQSLDPITEAKNKVLRMQELRKAQLLKIIDSTVSAKVPRVTKMLPLKDMVRDSAFRIANADDHANSIASKSKSDYEEIVIVSASSNTDISIPPVNILPNCRADSASLKNANNASRSLLKSSALLYNISNTFEKVKASEYVKLTSNSLITSIQGVVAKQTSSPLTEHQSATMTPVMKSATNAEQHGEDKIIMHLRKDRMRNRTFSVSIQTDILPEFPPLQLTLRNAMERKSRERKRYKRTRRNYRQRNAESLERNESDTSCSDAANSCRSRSRSAIDDSCESSTERLRRLDTTSGGYSSRSSRHHRSSISSSYSESERHSTHRSRKFHYKQRAAKKFSRSSSISSSEYSERTRSRSPLRRSRSRSLTKRTFVDRNISQPAVEERRIVYVGRIEQETNKEMLRRKFIAYGPIKQITLHYKDTGMKYGFVTYDRSQDAFNVIDNSARDPHINMYDISFGGRRAFCRASYADLDNAGINTYQSYVFPKAVSAPKEEDSFEALLLKVKAKMNANKTSPNGSAQTTQI